MLRNRYLSFVALCVFLSILLNANGNEHKRIPVIEKDEDSMKFQSAQQDGYTYSCVGTCTDIRTKTTAGTVLMGGGTDVDAAFKWMIERSGGGNFVVIRAAGTDAYNPYIYNLGGNGTSIHSVSTLIIISDAGSNNDFVYKTISSAEALFIAGGDQYKYVTLWNNTKVQDAISILVKKGVPIGGTSAGLHVLGGYVYTAATGGIDSDAALNNPYDPALTIGTNFLHVSPLLSNVITDSHFEQRDRMGRSVTFLARVFKDFSSNNSSTYHGISIDEQTAILLDAATGIGKIVNFRDEEDYEHSAYFLSSSTGPQQCVPDQPLTFQNVTVMRVGYLSSFDFVKWAPVQEKRVGRKINPFENEEDDDDNVVQYTISADSGELSSTQDGGDIY